MYALGLRRVAGTRIHLKLMSSNEHGFSPSLVPQPNRCRKSRRRNLADESMMG
jgi:hypothetical protein